MFCAVAFALGAAMRAEQNIHQMHELSEQRLSTDGAFLPCAQTCTSVVDVGRAILCCEALTRIAKGYDAHLLSAMADQNMPVSRPCQFCRYLVSRNWKDSGGYESWASFRVRRNLSAALQSERVLVSMCIFDSSRYHASLRRRLRLLIDERDAGSLGPRQKVSKSEWRSIVLGIMPPTAVQTHAHERMLIASLRHWWQRALYQHVLAARVTGAINGAALNRGLPGFNKRRFDIAARAATLMCACYMVFATLFLISFWCVSGRARFHVVATTILTRS